MIQPIRHDFRRVICELRALGVTHYKIGLAVCNGDNKKVARWVAGRSRPNHFEGELLLAMLEDAKSKHQHV